MKKSGYIILGVVIIAAVIGLGVYFSKGASTSSVADTSPTPTVYETASVPSTPSPAPAPTPAPTPSPAPGPKTFTMAQVSAHSTKTDCWTAINGSVYNLTSFIPNHPGGEAIVVVCGKDGTAAFTAQHDGGRQQAQILATLKIGVVAN